MANLLGGWDKIRRWLDNEPEDALPDIHKDHEPKSESELFLVKLLKAVEAVLQREIVRLPNTNKTYAPEKVVVYLSDETEKSLPREKREFFEQSLSALIYERAKELSGKTQLSVRKMTVEIQVDPTLGEEVEVRAVSKNEFETVKTSVENQYETVKTNEPPEFLPSSGSGSGGGETIDDHGTVEDVNARLGILYRVEIWQGNQRLNEYPIIQNVNTVGRDDAAKTGETANLRLPSPNRKISRFHAEIALEENGEVWVEALHKNPTVVSGRVIRSGERAKLGADSEIMIYDFTLKIKF